MAARPDPQGYDVSRFAGEVLGLICCFCKDVPKDPRCCQKIEHAHVFCHDHILRQLQKNSHTCPVCRDPLTPETLRRPTGFLKNCLDDLKIKCDHHDRGCTDVVRLEDLQRHVDQCGFAPVMCETEGCGMIVNKRDKEMHEKSFCQFRIAKCQGCRTLNVRQNKTKTEMKIKLDKLKGKLTGVERKHNEIQDEMKAESDKLKEKITGMERNQNEIKDGMKVELDEVKEKITGMERNQNEIKDEMKVELDEVKEKITGMERNQNEIKNGMQKELDDVKVKVIGTEKKQEQIKQSIDEVKLLLEKLMMQQENSGDKNVIYPVRKQNIAVVGGVCSLSNYKIHPLNTAESFDIVERKPMQLPSMNHAIASSASCIYNGDVIVTGGFDGKDGTDSIEILKMNQHPLRWTIFDGKLPVKLSDHVVIVYEDKLYVIGGYNWDENKVSDCIYELTLTPPYAPKLLVRMPQPRCNHSAVLVNDHLYVTGGTTTRYPRNAIDSVVVYDFIKNGIKLCQPLPKPVCQMSTVTCGNMIAVLGGVDNNGNVLNDVNMYDTETGQSERLPSLTHKRCGHCAVILHDVIVVLGGWNKKERHLNSVETFTTGGTEWRELPGMKEKRFHAAAVVKAHN